LKRILPNQDTTPVSDPRNWGKPQKSVRKEIKRRKRDKKRMRRRIKEG
jgi:hypothetical protein